MPKCANHDRLVSHLAFGICKLSHSSDHVYAKNSLTIWECPNVKLNSWCEHKNHSYMTIQKAYHFTKINIFDVHANFFIWSDNSWLEPTPSHEFLTQQKHDHFPLWHIFTHSNHLQIAWLMCLCIDIHVDLIFIDEWVGWSWCREEIIHQPKIGCSES